MSSQSQNEWVSRVLGVKFDSSGPSPNLASARRDFTKAQQRLTDAMTKADVQIRSLQAVLAVHPDAELKEIAGSPEFGLNALTGNFRVRLLAAFRDVDASGPDKLPDALARARTLITGLDDLMRSSPRLAACDENPLGISVSVRSMLGAALGEMSKSIDRLAA